MATTLDAEIEIANFDYVILIDVEGAELRVFEGCEKLISQKKTLFVFEYNYVTKEHFQLKELQALLGNDYDIYRINKKGKLDKKLVNTWNLAAIPKGQMYMELNELIKV